MTSAHPATRMAHLGLGAFHRAHQAWYTQRANDAGDSPWGIAAFTGRRPDVARALSAQDCQYTLVTRDASGDSTEHIRSIVAAHDGADADSWRRVLTDPAVTVVTLTVTEAAYGDTPVIRRLADGLAARRAAGAGPIAVVSCDNLPRNGAHTRRALLQASGGLADWLDDEVSFVDTVVDRITPATTDDDIAATGDPCTVVTEPFAEWYLSGEFPGGRPLWEACGARIVSDIDVFTRRKLWLLNAGHSLLAYAGLARGHAHIDEAMRDASCRRWLDELWDDVDPVLPLPPDEKEQARRTLVARFENPRIKHRLAQIARDGSEKLTERSAPIVAGRIRAGASPGTGQIRLWGAWLVHLRSRWTPDEDPGASAIAARARHDIDDGAAAVVDHLLPRDVAGEPRLNHLASAVAAAAAEIGGTP
ncbi:mannitol dehydrogenase family protein [Microbacterium sp. JB110]|uniref:mannitol dehydrogenase family protein n=1 Tax=Microbacterium sp. JB110 TaxID=2024477 RepID=UPI000B3586E4|nr:mannitol dehydrogenase family protein [Microbacterium sp. JB110]RCS60064.1 mannitol dehydrogenase family protein [Microbacterium sp. JB110]